MKANRWRNITLFALPYFKIKLFFSWTRRRGARQYIKKKNFKIKLGADIH
jgi:hypothetical protein